MNSCSPPTGYLMENDTRPAGGKEPPGRLFVTLAAAVAMVAALSLVPWSRLTAGFLKDFNLLGDLAGEVSALPGEAGDEAIDPALIAAQQQAQARIKAVSEAVAAGAEVPDSLLRPPVAPRRGDLVVLEDYSPGGDGLARFRNALARRHTRPVRIAVIGDSYIEGDIFTMDLREKLQERYGGRGVGYVAPHNVVSGFRPTVRQTDSGWADHDLRDDNSPLCRWLAGQRFTGAPGATVTWRAADAPPHVTGWNSATILFRSSGTGVVATDSGSGPWQHSITPSDRVQSIIIRGGMTSLRLTNKSVNGLTLIGVWLNDSTGVTVDNMSLRGNSGITHRNVDPALAREMAPLADYDLIVVEYGLNALTARQTDYSYYASAMAATLSRLKESYPRADIIMMGAGDRGHKRGAEVHSTPTLPYMIDAQRQTARRAGVLFWDTREAMGGDDAIVRWRADRLVNTDYIHLNFRGGARLADLFAKALDDALTQPDSPLTPPR